MAASKQKAPMILEISNQRKTFSKRVLTRGWSPFDGREFDLSNCHPCLDPKQMLDPQILAGRCSSAMQREDTT